MPRKKHIKTSCQYAEDYQNKIISELEAAPDAGYRFWTEFEKEVLLKYYLKKDIRLIARLLNRNITSIQKKAQELGCVRRC